MERGEEEENKKEVKKKGKKKYSTPVRFELTRAEPKRFLIVPLNHSGKVSVFLIPFPLYNWYLYHSVEVDYKVCFWYYKQKHQTRWS